MILIRTFSDTCQKRLKLDWSGYVQDCPKPNIRACHFKANSSGELEIILQMQKNATASNGRNISLYLLIYRIDQKITRFHEFWAFFYIWFQFSNLMKMELAPLYSISAILSMAAHEWRTGMAFLASTEPVIHLFNFHLTLEWLMEFTWFKNVPQLS